MKEEFNVEIIHQVLRSHYTNIPDIGVWRYLQSIVERKHYIYCCNVGTLCRTVMDAWTGSSLDNIIGKLFTRLENVICLLKEEKGANDTVKYKSGVKYENMKFEDIQSDNENNNKDEINKTLN